jgi:hypothetical protein
MAKDITQIEKNYIYGDRHTDGGVEKEKREKSEFSERQKERRTVRHC